VKNEAVGNQVTFAVEVIVPCNRVEKSKAEAWTTPEAHQPLWAVPGWHARSEAVGNQVVYAEARSVRGGESGVGAGTVGAWWVQAGGGG
jgi:hypothetical protein